jgi:hypothetical protein
MIPMGGDLVCIRFLLMSVKGRSPYMAMSWLNREFETDGKPDDKYKVLSYEQLIAEREEMLEAFHAEHENHSMSECFSCKYHEGEPRDPASPSGVGQFAIRRRV